GAFHAGKDDGSRAANAPHRRGRAADAHQHDGEPPEDRAVRPLQPAPHHVRRLAHAARDPAEGGQGPADEVHPRLRHHRNVWYHTGDMGYLDAEGRLFIVDRKKDMIISGGENVYSVEIENVLSTHPAVLEVAVVGVPDEQWGEAVKAIIVLREGAGASPDE